MKITKEELTDIIRQELSEAAEKLPEDSRPDFIRKWHEKTANKKANLSKIRTKTMMDLYMVMKNNPKTKREKDAVQKLFDELKKRGELKHIKSPMEESDEVNEEMHDCIQDYMEVHGYSYSEAMKKCKGSGWDEKGGKRGKRMRREDISEDDGANINPKVLTPGEIQLAIGAINFFGEGGHPLANGAGLKYFKVDYLADILAHNKSKLNPDARKHMEKLIKKLQKASN